MFFWFYGVWQLENILHLENGFQDTGKMTCNLGKMSYRFLFSNTRCCFVSSLSQAKLFFSYTFLAVAHFLDSTSAFLLLLVALVDIFIRETFGCSLAKHRKSDTLEAKGILLHLGFSGDEIKTYKKPLTNEVHKERLAVIKKSILASEAANAKHVIGQTAVNTKGNVGKVAANILGYPNVKIREVS
ncbi:hypothetical protein J1N35_011093 [Gossypium stocksii]|uniref:Transcription initiation factor TFIID subunit 12 domain-containing protein n=1 Tax=Gossypium stocksii TaxID=47602 RepID=A0A9D4AD32_9ROSI|nr:hypothetical protein J1N35_011093 [Gossypium stocksii]